jgi:putative flippase GtrA
VILAQIVDVKTLATVAGAALVVGVGVTTIFSFAIHGAVRFIDSRRDGRPLEAVFYAALLTVSLLASAGALVLGFVVMTKK